MKFLEESMEALEPLEPTSLWRKKERSIWGTMV
jgi:hypothetical protein